MAQYMENPAADHSAVIRTQKPGGRRGGAIGAPNGTSDTAGERSESRVSALDLNRALRKSLQECTSAQSKIESLVRRNAELEQKLVALAQREVQARRMAYHDELTGLPNRAMLQDRLSQAMSRANRQHKLVAVLLLDLDGFKRINDQLGHATGDKLLRAVAVRVTASIRGADTACRYGGDEFVVMLPEIDTAAMVSAVADKLLAYLTEPHVIDGFEICITASVGIALYPSEAETYEELLRRADLNMYRAKATRCDPCVKRSAKATFVANSTPLDLAPSWPRAGSNNPD